MVWRRYKRKIRDFFEIDANHIVLSILKSLNKETEFQNIEGEKINFLEANGKDRSENTKFG